MYFPPLFTSLPRPFESRTSNTLGGPTSTEVPLVGSTPTRENNPIDLTIKTLPHSVHSLQETSASLIDPSNNGTSDLMMLDHRKLANLAASHSLSAMGRQLGPAGTTAALMDPTTMYRLAYGPEALVPPPFCYDRATGVAVPTSLTGHQLMASFLQQQQRDRCLEQQQALFAARTTAAQQAAVAAAAAAFMDPAALPFNLRTAMTQRETAAALAATRGMYPPTMPTPMVLPAFSLYTDDKGAFTSLRNGGTADKAYMNGTSALEAARFAEHLQRIREQQLQQAAKCSNSCCSSLSGLGPTVPCACCIQSPSQAALCARSPMGCNVKDPTTAATANKVPNSTCDYLQPSLTFLHRPAAGSSNNSAEQKLSNVPTTSSHCVTTTTTSVTNNDNASSTNSVFHSVSSWTSGLPQVSNSGKTAFSVPKRKETSTNFISKEIKDSGNHERNVQSHNRDTERGAFNFKKNYDKKKDEVEPMYVHHETPAVPQPRREHDVKSLLTPRTTVATSTVISKVSTFSNPGVAHTTLTTVTSTVPTKCEGGTIMAKTCRMPPVLEPFRPVEPAVVNGDRFTTNCEATNLVSNQQGPPPLIAASNGHQVPAVNGKDHHSFSIDALRHQSLLHPGISSSPYKTYEKLLPAPDVHKSSPKKVPAVTKSNGFTPTYVKKESSTSKPQSSSTSALPKPIPHLPPPPSHLPPAHYASHYRPYSHYQNTSNWLPPGHPNVTVAQPPAPKTSPTNLSSSASVSAPKNAETVVKRENEHPGNSSNNVLQSLLVKAGTGMPSTIHGSYPSLLEYQYHHQNHLRHGLNLTQGGVAATAIESASPAAASIAPPLEKADIKVEGSVGSDICALSSAKFPKKRQFTASVKPEYRSVVPGKKRFLGAEVPPVPGFTFQYATIPTEGKDNPVCPYTFVPEPSGYFENQALVPNELRHQRPTLSIVQPLENKQTIENNGKHHSPNVPRCCENEQYSYYPVPFYATPEFHLKNVKRAAAARARSKLHRRILARLYQKSGDLCFGENSLQNQPAESQAIAYSPQDANRVSLDSIAVPNPVATSSTAPTVRNGRLLFKIAKRRRIRSGLDMVFKKNKKKTKRAVYKMEAAYPQEENSQKTPYGTGMLPMPVDMKRLMVNKALGETILHRAARLGYPEVVVYCLETNCGNVNTRDNAGYTPLHECCSRGHLDIARALLQYGADVNASAAGGIRPLHDAVENNHVEIVRLLLSFGADPSIATYSGLTPLKLAHSPLMAEFLQGFMADISGETEKEKRPHLPWRFYGSASCLDREDNGYDVFDGVPSDNEGEVEGEGDDFLFEVSDSPHLPTFRLQLPSANTKAHYNFLRLSDVLRKMSVSRDFFLQNYSHIEVLTVPRHEFEASATCSQLLSGSKMESVFPTVTNHKMDVDLHDNNGPTVDLVRLDNPIRKVLGIETICVR